MTRIRAIKTLEGGWVLLSPGTDAWRTDTGYLVAPRGAKPFLISADDEGSVGAGAQHELGRRGATPPLHTAATDIGLNRTILGPDSDAERRGIRRLLGSAADAGRGLVVDCGWGRILLPLVAEGLCLDGVGANRTFVADLLRCLPEGAGTRAFAAPLDSFCAPRSYDYAFAATDGLATLETEWAVRAHLRGISESLVPGAPYLFNIRLTTDPPVPYQVRHTVTEAGQATEVVRQPERYLRVRRQVIECITLTDADGATTHREYRLLPWLNADTLTELVNATPGLELERAFREDFSPTHLAPELHGRVWIALRRTEG